MVGRRPGRRILVPARTGEATRRSSWSTRRRRRDLAAGGGRHREPLSTVRLDGVAVEADACSAVPTGGGDHRVDRRPPAAAICATQPACARRRCAITARYTSEREQFGTKLATFQAVAHRVADAYIDTEAIRLTASRPPGGSARASTPTTS